MSMFHSGVKLYMRFLRPLEPLGVRGTPGTNDIPVTDADRPRQTGNAQDFQAPRATKKA
jgi:hypothetical protein